jgi:hypothetical protein
MAARDMVFPARGLGSIVSSTGVANGTDAANLTGNPSAPGMSTSDAPLFPAAMPDHSESVPAP